MCSHATTSLVISQKPQSPEATDKTIFDRPYVSVIGHRLLMDLQTRFPRVRVQQDLASPLTVAQKQIKSCNRANKHSQLVRRAACRESKPFLCNAYEPFPVNRIPISLPLNYSSQQSTTVLSHQTPTLLTQTQMWRC